ncbi:methyl-accepting chemotaxis protein [Planctobacterium marinum]|uniref:Methyl-accepting transducer domain-containing protein n=1 Tax=Planctobacterium marinum TaxID=1631968 RepID=A0AA48HMF3_9ALTE|nr:hypothetical protein MACH26_17380 [Planctobacterium marinum]
MQRDHASLLTSRVDSKLYLYFTLTCILLAFLLASQIHWAPGLLALIVLQALVNWYLLARHQKILRETLEFLHLAFNSKPSDTVNVQSEQQFKSRLLAILNIPARRISVSEDSVAEISHSTQELNNHSTQLATNILQQSQATSSLAAGIAEVEQTLNEVSRNIADIRSSVQSTNELSHSGVHSVSEVRSHIEQVANLSKQSFLQLKTLEELTQGVSSITDLIGEVSAQTNLLALNAAIEAARAGEHGKGFAVVASEVRILADKTSQSAQQINEHIQNVKKQSFVLSEGMTQVVERIEDTVAEASNIESLLNNINQRSSQIACDIQTIAGASQQQQLAAAEMSNNIEELAVTAQENGYAAKQTARIADHVWSLTNDSRLVV